VVLIRCLGSALSNFRQIDGETGFLLPPSVDEWLPERHLARFSVEVIAGLDLRSMSGSYRGSGSASYHPKVLLGLLVINQDQVVDPAKALRPRGAIKTGMGRYDRACLRRKRFGQPIHRGRARTAVQWQKGPPGAGFGGAPPCIGWPN